MAAAILTLVLIVVVVNNKPIVDPVQPEEPVVKPSADKQTVTISVPGIDNVELISEDNQRLSVPHTVAGKEGDRFEFTIHADGYKDKKVEVMITARRSSFEYNLEKINN